MACFPPRIPTELSPPWGRAWGLLASCTPHSPPMCPCCSTVEAHAWVFRKWMKQMQPWAHSQRRRKTELSEDGSWSPSAQKILQPQQPKETGLREVAREPGAWQVRGHESTRADDLMLPQSSDHFRIAQALGISLPSKTIQVLIQVTLVQPTSPLSAHGGGTITHQCWYKGVSFSYLYLFIFFLFIFIFPRLGFWDSGLKFMVSFHGSPYSRKMVIY